MRQKTDRGVRTDKPCRSVDSQWELNTVKALLILCFVYRNWTCRKERQIKISLASTSSGFFWYIVGAFLPSQSDSVCVQVMDLRGRVFIQIWVCLSYSWRWRCWKLVWLFLVLWCWTPAFVKNDTHDDAPSHPSSLNSPDLLMWWVETSTSSLSRGRFITSLNLCPCKSWSAFFLWNLIFFQSKYMRNKSSTVYCWPKAQECTVLWGFEFDTEITLIQVFIGV